LLQNIGVGKFADAEIVTPQNPHKPQQIGLEKLNAIGLAFSEQLEFPYASTDVVQRSSLPEDELIAVEAGDDQSSGGKFLIADTLLSDEQDAIATLSAAISRSWILANVPLAGIPSLSMLEQYDGSVEFAEEPEFDESSLAWIAELIPVLLGWGIFAANTTLYASASFDVTSVSDRWTIGVRRSMPSRVYGYALALFAWGHPDSDLSWAKMLQPDAAEPFQMFLKYLQKTDDSVFAAGRIPTSAKLIDESEYAAIFASGTDCQKVVLLNQLADEPGNCNRFVDDLMASLDDRESEVAAAAMRCFTVVENLDDEQMRLIGSHVHGKNSQMQRSALQVLKDRKFDNSSGMVVVHKCFDGENVLAAVEMLMACYPNESSVELRESKLVPGLLKACHRFLADAWFEEAEQVVAAIALLAKDPKQRIADFFVSDVDLLDQAMGMLEFVESDEFPQ
jgi:hypothetical protein